MIFACDIERNDDAVRDMRNRMDARLPRGKVLKFADDEIISPSGELW